MGLDLDCMGWIVWVGYVNPHSKSKQNSLRIILGQRQCDKCHKVLKVNLKSLGNSLLNDVLEDLSLCPKFRTKQLHLTYVTKYGIIYSIICHNKEMEWN